SVTVSPASANVLTNTSQQFAASVNGSANQGVTWSVNGVIGGNSVLGTISTAGLYIAPVSVPSAASVTVQATSQATPSAVGTAAVTITSPVAPVSVIVTPSSASIQVNTSLTFGATVQNSSNQIATWSVNGVTGG